jgi:hypothetical protein
MDLRQVIQDQREELFETMRNKILISLFHRHRFGKQHRCKIFRKYRDVV